MKASTLWIIAGVLSLVGGIVALFNPFGATLTAVFLAGWIFLFSGIVHLISAFSETGTSAKIWAILWALVVTLLGIAILANPLAGVLSLTLAAAILFTASGLFRVIFAINVRGTGLFWPLLLTGLIAIGLGVYIFATYPGSAAVLLGTLLGIELIFNGVALIMLYLAGKAVKSAFEAVAEPAP